MDRIDIHIETPAVKIEELQTQQLAEESSSILKRVEACRELQRNRYKKFNTNIYTNSEISPQIIDEVCMINKENKNSLRNAMNQLSLWLA